MKKQFNIGDKLVGCQTGNTKKNCEFGQGENSAENKRFNSSPLYFNLSDKIEGQMTSHK